MLPVPLTAFVALPPLLLENDDLFVLFVFEDLGRNGGSIYSWRAKSGFAVVNNHEYLVDLYQIAFVCLGEAVHEQLVSLFDSELTALCLYCGFHVEENR